MEPQLIALLVAALALISYLVKQNYNANRKYEDIKRTSERTAVENGELRKRQEESQRIIMRLHSVNLRAIETAKNHVSHVTQVKKEIHGLSEPLNAVLRSIGSILGEVEKLSSWSGSSALEIARLEGEMTEIHHAIMRLFSTSTVSDSKSQDDIATPADEFVDAVVDAVS